ncbi:MAG: hypothetical protein WC979_05785 [Candidatus Pacearchaeota archaeon]|jgi:hypothetical protein
MKSKTNEKSSKNKLISILKNKYLWIILIPDILIGYFIIKYSAVLLIAFLLNNPNLRIVGFLTALVVCKAIIDLIVLIKLIRK